MSSSAQYSTGALNLDRVQRRSPFAIEAPNPSDSHDPR
jgi:hypothetical protein